MGVSLTEFEKAVQALGNVLMLPEDDVVRDASIQRFEFCVELAWKTSRKLMGTTTTAPKQVIREMAQNGYISDIQKWFDALEKRNLSSHTYDEVLARDVYQFIKLFAPEFRRLLDELRKK
jgi:nucleotidyltransferase substrate binding protein (TIGR01987 family)